MLIWQEHLDYRLAIGLPYPEIYAVISQPAYFRPSTDKLPSLCLTSFRDA